MCSIISNMSGIIFKRKIYKKFLEWKEQNGKYALLVQGARRIGKSTIVEEFAKNEYETYILIDFSVVSPEIRNLFSDMSNLNNFFLRLQFYTNVKLIERKSVIIFDEVQREPLARQAIKHLVADGRYDYIETGSLISIKKNTKNILIPSEEFKLNMYPMDYEEFRWALGDNVTIKLLAHAFESGESLGQDMNRRLMRDFRLYMLVGGMPQAVSEFITSNNFSAVDQVKRSILDLYADDFRKIDPTGKATLLFKGIPAELSKNTSRYQVSSQIPNGRQERITELVSEMAESMTVNIAWHANDPGAGMFLNRDFERFKMFICDTGLFITQAFADKSFTENVIYEKLLSDKLDANLGYVYENIVAQMLKANGNELFYYTFRNEGSTHLREIDFILSRGNKILPIEVKSSANKSHISIDEFCKKYSNRIKNGIVINTKDLGKYGTLRTLPFYLIMFL